MKFHIGRRGPKIPGKKCCPFWVKTLLWVLFVLIVLTAFACVALQQTGFADVLKIAYKIQQQKSDEQILAQLSKIMLLPEDTKPTIKVITDAQTLKNDQPGFFTNAKNGDILIIYPDKAIIFDASANKIIQVGPVVTNPPTFALYNGTSSNKTLTTYERKLLLAVTNAQVKVRANAVGNYDKTLIIDITGKNASNIQTLADTLGATVSGMPIGETAPSGVDFLIIIGNNG